MRLEELAAGTSVIGIVAGGPVDLLMAEPLVGETRRVVYRTTAGGLGEQILMRSSEPGLALFEEPRTPFDADAEEFKLAAEAVRIQCAALIDPKFAVTSSDLEPLPHQIEAVYGHLLDRVPLRFLLADDPGAGKTIMAGLYIKELALRGDMKRCLIVAPGGLVDQWQDELFEKFALRFEILSNEMISGTPRGQNVFLDHDRLIARLDHVVRNKDLRTAVVDSTWDLVVVDEAHRMSAQRYGRKINKTKRYELGEDLRDRTHNLLLMTATPHTGRVADFELFLALLDSDRFAGEFRGGESGPTAEGLMLRRVKEDLLTLDGRHLFPARRAYTVPYELSPGEAELYEQVTGYVRNEFNRADALQNARGKTVGFALTVLQRRLASSPEAILRSLERRRQRLEDRLREATVRPRSLDSVGGQSVDPDDAYDDEPSSDLEHQETEVLDAATAARTADELRLEIEVLGDLVDLARRVYDADTDRKWSELRALLSGDPELSGIDGPRKLIIFTEHRDTLSYLRRKIGAELGMDAVEVIHGGMAREARRAVQHLFTDGDTCQVLLATDAAGEGLNLQRAHLMVNYDLPWNPNRIEQRFGRIHRIGQRHMCHLWNLVAANTREGEVFHRLLEKIEEMNVALGGKVFDVLGEAFEGHPLHQLLLEAVRRGEDPEYRDHLLRVIDERVGETAVGLVRERALHHDMLTVTDQERVDVGEAQVRSLQPHYVEGFFGDAYKRAGGRLTKREPGRFHAGDVPGPVRALQKAGAPIKLRYERVCFDRKAVRSADPVAEFLSPGHPLLDAVVQHTIDRHGAALGRGAVLVDRLDPETEPRLLVAVSEEIVDGTGDVIAKRFDYVELWREGRARHGNAPFLDYAAPDETERFILAGITTRGWPAMAHRVAQEWAAGQHMPGWYQKVSDRRRERVERTRKVVAHHLDREIDAAEREIEALEAVPVKDGGWREKMRAAVGTLEEMQRRLETRTARLDREANTQARPPVVVAIALVVPQGMLDQLTGREPPPLSRANAEVERRALARVMREERRLGRSPEPMTHNNPGYDIRSSDADGNLVYIEVKGREPGAETFFVTNREIRTGQNAPAYRLALVEVDVAADREEARYIDEPFTGVQVSALVNSVQFRWKEMWERGTPPK